jgi:putative FmdB family regulatory protein
MPIYEYKCLDCNKKFEVMQKVSDPVLTSCIHCTGRVTKLISPAGLVFKGAGFYITDYASKGKEKDKENEKPSASTASSSETKNAASPAPKTDPVKPKSGE